MQIEMAIKGLMVDPITNMPIIILRDRDGQRVLPIWVGIFEANAIALQIENISTPRPMTHDLLRNVIEDLNGHGREDRGLATSRRTRSTRSSTSRRPADVVAIDARPSDAIALALRTQAPIFVEETRHRQREGRRLRHRARPTPTGCRSGSRASTPRNSASTRCRPAPVPASRARRSRRSLVHPSSLTPRRRAPRIAQPATSCCCPTLP